MKGKNIEDLLEGEQLIETDRARLAFYGAHRALQFVDRESKNNKPVTEDLIKEIHSRCMDGLLPEGVFGKYRTCDVGISRASITPPHWSRVPLLMGKFVEETNRRIEQCYQGIHNLSNLIETMAFVHYAFVRIHPFEDGNGRTVRFLCDFIAKKFGLRPIIIWPSERDEYIDTLEAVNRSGNLAHFELLLIRWFIQRYIGEGKGRNGELLNKLRDLKREQEDSIREQQEKQNIESIWSVFSLFD